MIVKMKKLTLLCTRDSREETLAELRALGAVHLQHIQPPEGADLEEARKLVDHLRRALDVLPKHPHHVEPSGKTPHETVKAVWELIHRKQKLIEEIEAVDLEIRHIEPFGSFSPETVRELAAEGVAVSLCHLPLKALPELPDGVRLIELSRDRTSLYGALIARGELNLKIETLPLPRKSLDEMKQELAALKADLETTEDQFRSYAGDHAAVASLATDAEDRVHYLEARAGMGDSEHVFYLRGFFPAEEERALRAKAGEKGWAVLVEEPTPDDRVPTLLRNPKWVKPIKAVLDIIGVSPGYHELDISALFMIFLSIFFAFLIGDAGYGLLFIALTLIAKFKLRGNEKAKPGLNLLMIMSSCTVVWGALTGTWFGITPEVLPAPLQHLRLDWLRGDEDTVAQRIMLICFVLGSVHLAIAHVWNFVRKINSWAALADLGWLCSTVAMFFAVRMMVLGAAFPPAMTFVLGTGVTLIILSLILQKEYFGLVTLVLDVINNFVDIISYVRLYAVGAASFAIANSFNTMAIEAWGSNGVIAGGLIAALCLFLGHTLNIVLGGMAILVHGIRLNTLEFSGHAGVQWGGFAFKPFVKRKEEV
jgi:V/A-type H+/Na+-transporting ATPase subunit I